MMAGRGAHGGSGATDGPVRHIPVLLREVLDALAPRDGERFIDGTFGAGGYTRAILEAAATRVIAIDRDPSAIRAGAALVKEFASRLTLAEGRFGTLDEIATAHGVAAVDGVVLDIGVSSMQIDAPERGFSFQSDGPLDMRMAADGPTAADIVNSAAEADLADVLYQLGEERRSRAIARAICREREKAPIETTGALARLVARTIGRPERDQHPATRTFQALRILVNDELGELVAALSAAERVLKPGGRLVVVSFHSLEDRIVKRFLAERSGRRPATSRHAPPAAHSAPAAGFRIVNQRPLTPSQEEIAANPRARSARLRAAVRTAEPVAPPPDAQALALPQVPMIGGRRDRGASS